MQSGRLDAEYYQPKNDELETYLKNYRFEADSLGNLIYSVQTGDFSNEFESKSENLIFYIKNTNVKQGRIEWDYDCFTSPNKISKFVEEGDILTARVGAIGNFGIVTKEFTGSAYSDNVLGLKLQDGFDSYTYSVYFNTFIVSELINRISGGSVQSLVTQTSIKELLVPILPIVIQEKISNKIQESFALKTQSKQLLEIAKRGVELAIEQDETIALTWMEKENKFVYL